MSEGRFERAALLALAALLAALHALALFHPSGLWGAHFFAFLPPLYGWTALALVAASALPLLAAGRAGAGTPPEPATPPAALPARGGRALRVSLLALGALAAGALFWIFRIRHLLLGDGLPLTARLPAGERFHDLEPLTALIQHGLYQAARTLEPAARPGYLVAWDAVAAGSAIAGALFVPVAWAIAGEIVRDGAEARPFRRRALIFGLLLAQGYVQLFFGYVENYTWYALAAGLYLLLALRCLRGAGGLLVAAAALLLAMALHLSGGVLIPSFLALAALGLAVPERRGATARDVALAGMALAWLAPGYRLGATFLDVAGRALGHPGEAAAGSYLLGAAHQRDFLNEQLLIGPLPLPLFLIGLAGVASARRGGAAVVFAAAAGLSVLGASWLAGDSNLGYARNWDLLAPGALVMLVAALVLWREQAGRAPGAAPLVLALALSLAHTVPWIAVNASETRALRRFATLPLGLGRTEATLGHWNAVRGRTAEAERWLVRALDLNPGNVRAHVFLGELYLERGQAVRAREAFAAAVRLRPDKREYLLDLIAAEALAGRLEEARSEVERLLRAHPQEPSLWGMDGVLLALDGDPADARDALGRAAALAPAEPVYRRVIGRLDGPRDATGLEQDWLEMLRLAKAALP